MATSNEPHVIPVELIERRIYLIRGQKVMLDSDLAFLYQVPTKVFNQAVRRNHQRFPADFMFQLTREELGIWRSQIVTSNPSAKMAPRRRPHAFLIACLGRHACAQGTFSLFVLNNAWPASTVMERHASGDGPQAETKPGPADGCHLSRAAGRPPVAATMT